MQKKTLSTPSRLKSTHPSRGESWNSKSPYPYWETFKDKKKLGFDIDRQVIIGTYIVDFFIPELGLVFEIDGSSHNDKAEYDSERDAFMKDLNLEVIRILYIDVKQNLGNVYSLVLEMIEKRKILLNLFPS